MRKRYHKIKAQIKAKTASAVRFAETTASGSNGGGSSAAVKTEGTKGCVRTMTRGLSVLPMGACSAELPVVLNFL